MFLVYVTGRYRKIMFRDLCCRSDIKIHIKLTESMHNNVKSLVKTIHYSVPVESITAIQIPDCHISCKKMH